MKAWFARTRWYQKLLLVLVLLWLLYLVLAPLVLAFWGRAKLVDEVAALTGKQVTLGGLYFNPLTNSVTLKDFAIADNGADILRFERFSADLELMPLVDHQLYLRDVALVAPYVKLVRLPDGKHINLQTLFQPQAPSAPPPQSSQTQPQAQAGLALMPVITRLDISQGQLEWVDTSLPKTPSILIDHINLHSSDLTLASAQPAPVQLALDFPEGGHLTLNGKLTPQPLAATAAIKLTQLALPLANPWLASVMHGRLVSGQLSTELALTLAGSALQLAGQAEVQKLQLDNADDTSMVSLDSLAVTGLKLDTAVHQITLAAINVAGLVGQFDVYADGTTSIDKLLLSQTPVKTPVAKAPQSAAADAVTPPWQLSIQQIKLAAKTLTFHDQSVAPSYALTAKPLTLTLGPLDTRATQPALLEMSTKLGGYAPLSVKGKVDAFAKRTAVNLAIRLQGYDMTNLTPYTGMFIGYQVQKGQLGVNTDMALSGSMLTSRSSIDANNFYLGNKVKSKDAINAPVKFGLSILRDGKGNISLPLKVSGDLADPSVSVHGLVLQALLNVLVKAATAPLSALSLLAGGVDLEKVEFAAGSASLEQAELESLAAVLAQRPALKLGLSGSSSAADAAFFSAQGQSGDDLAQSLKTLATARAKALKLMLIDSFAIHANRLYLEQPTVSGKISGVLLSAINQ